MTHSNQKKGLKQPDTQMKRTPSSRKMIAKALFFTAILLNCGGNLAHASLGNETSDSNKIEYALTGGVGDELMAAKISIPNGKTFRRADREINRNMANDLRELNNLKLEPLGALQADETISNEFYSNFKLTDFYPFYPELDEQLAAIFLGENLNNNLIKNSLLSDNEVNKSFSKSYAIKQQSNFQIADNEINALFKKEVE
ncbi:MAG: hypothetical protein RLY11_302 [Bacteroidota bacterium]